MSGLRLKVAACAVVVLAAFALLLAGCAAGVPDEAPSIVGRAESVTGATGGQSVLSMMVRGKPTDGATFDAASVRVTRDTKVFAGTRAEPRDAAAEDISEGARVMVWFTGPVAESYPVQATAGTVLILE